MSDGENVVDSPEVAPEAPELTKEHKLLMVKGNLCNQLVSFHNNLFNFVNGLPINEDQKKFALANLIQALHWVEDGIEALHFEVQDSPQEPRAEGCESPAENVTQPTEGEAPC